MFLGTLEKGLKSGYIFCSPPLISSINRVEHFLFKETFASHRLGKSILEADILKYSSRKFVYFRRRLSQGIRLYKLIFEGRRLQGPPPKKVSTRQTQLGLISNPNIYSDSLGFTNTSLCLSPVTAGAATFSSLSLAWAPPSSSRLASTL